MDTQTQDDIIAEGAGTFEGMDMITSPHGGHLVVVSVNDGAHVCQYCGETFEEFGARAAVEKKTPKSSVPILMHPGCPVTGRRRSFFDQALATPRTLMKAMAGANALRMAKRVIAGSHRLAEAAREGAKKIIL